MRKTFTVAAKTAIKRTKMSAPTRQVLRVEMEVTGFRKSWLDYGCGKGDDVRLLRAGLNGSEHVAFNRYGWAIAGYDPGFGRDDRDVLGKEYDVVTCNFVLNVIQSPEQQETVVMAVLESLAWRGAAYFATRTDVRKEGFTSIGTYQRNMPAEELLVLVQGAIVAMGAEDRFVANVLKSDRKSGYALVVVGRIA